MSKTLRGTMTVTLLDDEYTLKPTLDAVRKIEARFGGLRGALEALSGMSVEVCAIVIAAGAGLGQRQAKELPEAVFETGVADVTAQLLPYISVLMNPSGAEADDEEEAGNVKKKK